MGSEMLIAGAGVVAFILVYMLFRLGDRTHLTGINQHYGLQIILLFMVVDQNIL